MTTKTILVVDDEIGIRELLSEILFDEGYSVLLAENAEQARELIKRQPDLVLLDIWMPDTDGLTLLKEWVAKNELSMPVVMMSGHGTIETAVEATKIGAADFLEKPIALKKLLATIEQTLRRHQDQSVKPAMRRPNNKSESFTMELPLNLPFKEARAQFDRLYLSHHLAMAEGSLSELADKLGIERTYLYRKLRQLNLKPPKKAAT